MAIAIGIVSGLASTGSNELVKQITKKGGGENDTKKGKPYNPKIDYMVCKCILNEYLDEVDENH